MELHQLKYFIAVVETGSFSKAAKRCFVAQPSLSQQIIKLEKEIGHKLFDRLGKNVVLTDAGHTLLPSAKNIINESNEIKHRISDESLHSKGTLSVGIIPTIAPYILPICLRKFKEHNPNAVIKISENLTDRLIEQLIKFNIDIAIMSLPINNKLISNKVLFEDPLVLSAPLNNKFSKQKLIKTKDLDDVPFVALDEEHCFGEQVKNFCYEKSIDPDVVCKTWNINTILNCVSSDVGVSIIPLMAALNNMSGKYSYRYLKENPTRTIVSSSYRDRTKKDLALKFEKIVVEEYKKLKKKNTNKLNTFDLK